MNEISLVWISFIKLIIIAIFALLYSLGGVDGKWKRRFLAPAIYFIGLIGFSLIQKSFSFFYLISIPVMIGALSLGYGSDSTAVKVFKRLLCGVVASLAALPIAIINHAWILLGIHICISIAFSVILGVFNPVQAREEENLIATSYVLLPIYMI